MTKFTISPNAPVFEVEEIRPLTDTEMRKLRPGLQFICESIQDNDMERWFLTDGGQFVRQTGVEGERLFLTDSAFALDFLAGYCDDDQMENLVQVNAFKGAIQNDGMKF